jgi:hypothetical protein
MLAQERNPQRRAAMLKELEDLNRSVDRALASRPRRAGDANAGDASTVGGVRVDPGRRTSRGVAIQAPPRTPPAGGTDSPATPRPEVESTLPVPLPPAEAGTAEPARRPSALDRIRSRDALRSRGTRSPNGLGTGVRGGYGASPLSQPIERLSPTPASPGDSPVSRGR